MIKKSTFNRIIFFVTISISYLSYRTIQNIFFERSNNGVREISVAHSTKEAYHSIPFKKLYETSQEAPFSKTIGLEYIPTTSYHSDYTLSSKIRSSTTESTYRSSNASRTKNIIATDGGYQSAQSSNNYEESIVANSGGGGGGDAGAGGSAVAQTDDGSTDASDMGGSTLNIDLVSSTSTSSIAYSPASSSSGNGSSARLGISASPSKAGNSGNGISTTPSIGGSQTPMVQAPPPPPPPVPLDTHSVIFILMGAAMGVYVFLKNSKKYTAVKNA